MTGFAEGFSGTFNALNQAREVLADRQRQREIDKAVSAGNLDQLAKYDPERALKLRSAQQEEQFALEDRRKAAKRGGLRALKTFVQSGGDYAEGLGRVVQLGAPLDENEINFLSESNDPAAIDQLEALYSSPDENFRVHSVQQGADGTLYGVGRDGSVSVLPSPDGQPIIGRLPVAVREVGGVPTAISGGSARNVTAAPLSNLPAEAQAAATIAGAEAQAKELGQSTGKAQFGLPQAEVAVQSAVSAIDEVIADPALKAAFGLPSPRGAAQGGLGSLATVPGTPAADAVARLKNIQGKVFKEAFESLKGGGPITEREGQAATEALANLDRAQSYEAAVRELRKLKKLLGDMYEARRGQAGQGQQPQAGDARLESYTTEELEEILSRLP